MTIACGLSSAPHHVGGRRKRGVYDLWNRAESNEVLYEVLKRLGFSDCCVYSGSYPLYNTYRSLPPLDLRESSLELIAAHALFSKNDDMPSPIDRNQVAFESFLLSEESCEDVNRRFRENEFSRCPVLSSILHYARRYCANVLGDCPDIDDLDCSFGPGATASNKNLNGTTARWKLSATCTISESAYHLRDRLRACFPAWLGDRNIVPAIGLLDFVPKSHKTSRTIMIEPLLNTFVQKGIGAYLKKRLYRRGINLFDQSAQRERARLGSVHGNFATIDLSRASDSIASYLVLDLLPLDWFDLLSSFRTPTCSYKKRYFTLEKFSSMGNGFTFELETLIFKSLISGIATYCGLEDDSICYGDDITANTPLARAITFFFKAFGFTVNSDKSFYEGCVREACGGDYRAGLDIRPWFLRGLRDGGRFSYAKIVSYHNFLQRKPWFDKVGIRKYLLSLIPPKFRLWGPDGYGDSWLVSLSHPATYLQRASSRYPGWEGYLARGFMAIPYRDETPCKGDVLLPAYSAGRGPCEDIYALRLPKGARMRARFVRAIVQAHGDCLSQTEGPDYDLSRLVVQERE